MEKIKIKQINKDNNIPVFIEHIIYSLDELQMLDVKKEIEEHFDEDYELLGASLYVSVSVAMWRFCHVCDELSTEEIIKIMTDKPDWFKDYFWTAEQRAEYEHLLVPIFVKWMDEEPYEAWNSVCIWSGFGSSFSFEDKSREYYDKYLVLVSDLNELDNDELIDFDDVKNSKIVS